MGWLCGTVGGKPTGQSSRCQPSASSKQLQMLQGRLRKHDVMVAALEATVAGAGGSIGGRCTVLQWFE